ncbi:N-6 DNA methylase [Actinomadura sediminis]|uniref:site-specific DNA-methyltransferase (adenine-specific) n=1 Tax=Actinomadura sediminis TaxID=1038904 RepID=A0ABW3ESQ9_9ACTN
MINPSTLVSSSDIARRAGVQRAAVSNWRRRHADFPAPVVRSPGELFKAEQVAIWLGQRAIPAGSRRPDEAEGTTFGDRFRGTFDPSGRDGRAEDVDPRATERRERRSERSLRSDRAFDRPRRDGRANEIATRLMNWLWRLRTIGDPAAHADVLLTALYLRAAAPQGWDELVRRWRERSTGSMDDLEHALRGHVARDRQLMDMLWEPRWWAESPFLGPRNLSDLIDLLATTEGLSDKEVASEVAAELTERIAAWEGHRGGEFHTPRSVADLLARLVDPQPGEHVHDPCCGTGDLLVAAAARLPSGSVPMLSGSALSPRPLLRAGLNLALHGLRADLAPNALARIRGGPFSAGPFHCVISNPPFAMREWTTPGPSSPGHWRYGDPPKSNADFAWLQHIIGSLTPEGRAAVVMAPGSTFRGGRERWIRMAMLEDGVVSCVIRLPQGLFHTTNIPVTVWVLEKGRSPGSDVLLIDATDVAPDDFGEIVDAYRDRRTCERSRSRIPARACSLGELRDADYRLDPRALVSTRKTDSAGRERIDHLSERAAIDRLVRRSVLLDAKITQIEPVAADAMDGPHASRWPRRSLGDLCLIRTGPARIPSGTAADAPVVTARQIKDRRVHDEDLQYASARFAETSSQYRLRRGDVVCIRTGSISRAALIDADHEGWILGRGCLLLRPGPGVRPGYLLHCLSHPQVDDWVARRASGSVMPTISVQRLRELPIPVPPRARQDEICALLDAIDEKAALHAEIVRRTQRLHGAALTALLGDAPTG